jgi:CorA-like Mg2+ transporter protein
MSSALACVPQATRTPQSLVGSTTVVLSDAWYETRIHTQLNPCATLRRYVEGESGSAAVPASGSGGAVADFHSRMLNRIEDFQNEDSDGDAMEETTVMQELRELFEAEEEEQELQEVEDLLEYYLQRNTSIQTEAERLLAGARDLEESIGLALSARRFEVQRLELRLSIGSFAAALGAVIAGIFGMNLRSTFEESIIGFWGTTAAIFVGCYLVYVWILRFTRKRKILM